MIRHLFIIIVFISLLMGSTGCRQQEQRPEPKYLFLFIGDGMGVAQVNLAEAYLAVIHGEKGFEQLSFSGFPVSGLVRTYADNRFITCSAAAGTAFATGYKTNIGHIATDTSGQVPYKSIATICKEHGMKTGILTSVSLDHATPAVFYAHQPSRDNYFEIGMELAGSDFDFFAGGGFKEPDGVFNGKQANAIDAARENGFTYVNTPEGFGSLDTVTGKVIAVHPDLLPSGAMPYVIDNPGSPSLADFTAMAIKHLDNKDGFFMMVEGGKIDWACHSKDAASSIQETIAFSEAVQAAIDFYQKHPEETLILVTADHETGGLALGAQETGYNSFYTYLQYQDISVERFNEVLAVFGRQLTGNETSDRESLLTLVDNHFGLGSKIPITEQDKSVIWEAFEQSLKGKNQQETVYTEYPTITETVISMVSSKSGVGWTTFKHTGINIPIYALGPGAERFTGVIDNTDIPRIMEELMGFDNEAAE
ncbi:MAG: alkaline phosphatase [bacterium]|jgi:alkaline phosphatase